MRDDGELQSNHLHHGEGHGKGNVLAEEQQEESCGGVPKPSVSPAPDLPSPGGKLLAGSVDVSALYPALETEKCAKIISTVQEVCEGSRVFCLCR